jgi:hypothetical protein
MASAPKKNAAAQAAPAGTESAPEEALVAPSAVFVMPQGSAEDREASSPAAEDAFAAASRVEKIQQSFRSALEKVVAESRAALTNAKTAADEATSGFEVSFAAVKDGARASTRRLSKRCAPTRTPISIS